MRRAARAATTLPHHIHAITGYVAIVQELWRLGRLTEVEQVVAEGEAYRPE